MPEQFKEGMSLRILLPRQEPLMLIKRDAAPSFEANPRPLARSQDRPRQPLHSECKSVQPPQEDVGGNSAVLHGRQKMLGPSFDERNVADGVQSLFRHRTQVTILSGLRPVGLGLLQRFHHTPPGAPDVSKMPKTPKIPVGFEALFAERDKRALDAVGYFSCMQATVNALRSGALGQVPRDWSITCIEQSGEWRGVFGSLRDGTIDVKRQFAVRGASGVVTSAPVDTARVTRGALLVTVDDDGRTRVKDRYVVFTPLTGRMERISLKSLSVFERRERVLYYCKL